MYTLDFDEKVRFVTFRVYVVHTYIACSLSFILRKLGVDDRIEIIRVDNIEKEKRKVKSSFKA